MSTTIDRRVVGLGFDGAQFESGVKSSIKYLGDLKTSLNLTESARSLNTLSAAGKSFSMEGMANSIENVSSKFSAFGVVAFTVLQNITNSVMTLSNQMVSGLFLDPIKKGLDEYETGLNSVQTILANTSAKGTNIDQVNAALLELNNYADKTIYNFAEMARNIGTFTAAGVDLDVSVAAIKGIANLAAVSGSNAQQASTAMYQLSQALASGTVKLMDWNSIVNAGMGGAVFQDALKETARAHGVAIDSMIKNEGSFRETLQNGWLTSSILTETLSKFTGDLTAEQIKAMAGTTAAQSQFYTFNKQQMESLKLTEKQLAALKLNSVTAVAIGANFSESQLKSAGLSIEQIKLVTSYYKQGQAALGAMTTTGAGYTDQQVKDIMKLGVTAQDAATKVKTFSQLVGTLNEANQSGWSQSWMFILGDFEQAKALFTELNKILGSVIGSSSDARNKILKEWNEMGGREEIIYGLRAALEGVMNIGKSVGEVIAAIFPPITARNLEEISRKIMYMGVAFRNATQESDLLKRIFMGIAAVFQIVIMPIEAIGKALGNLIGNLTGNLTAGFDMSAKGILGFLAGIGDSVVVFKDMLKNTNFFGNALANIGPFLMGLGAQFVTFWQSLGPRFAELNLKLYEIRLQLEGFFAPLKPIFEGIESFFRTIGEAGTRLSKDLEQPVKDVVKFFGGFGETLKSLYNEIGPSFEKINKFFTELSGKINKVYTDVKPNLDKLKETMAVTFSTGNSGAGEADGFRNVLDGFNNFLEGAKSVWKWFSDTFTTLGTLLKPVWEGITGGLSTIGTTITEKLSAITPEQVSTGLKVGLVAGFGLALKGLFKNLNPLSGIGDAISGVTDLLGGVQKALVSWQASLNAKTLQTLAISIAILVASLIALTFVDPKKLGAAIFAITSLFLELAGTLKLLDTMKGLPGMTNVATQMLALAASVLVLTFALKIIAGIDEKDIDKGLFAIGALLLEMGIFMKATQSTGLSPKTAGGILILAGAMIIMSLALKLLGNLSWDEIGRSLVTLGVTLGILVVTINKLKVNKMATAAFGIGLLAGAFMLMSIALKALGGLSLEEIAKGLGTMAAMMTGLVLAMKFLKTGDIIKMAVAMTILGAGMMVLSIALKALGNLSWSEIAVGLTVMAGALALIGITLNAMKSSQAIQSAIAIGIVAGAMIVMSIALKALGNLGWEEIAKGLVSIAGVMLILAVALNFMQKALPGAAAVLVIAFALAILVPVLLALGNTPWQVLVTGLLALAGIFAVLAVASLAAPAILSLGIAVGLLALALLGVGLAIGTFASGMALLAVSGLAGMAVFSAIVAGFIALIPSIIVAIVNGLAQFALAISDAAPGLKSSILKTMYVFLTGILEMIPAVVLTIFILIGELLMAFAVAQPRLIQAGMDILYNFMKGIEDNIYRITTSAINIIRNFCNALVDQMPEIVKSGYAVVEGFLGAMATLIGEKAGEFFTRGLPIATELLNGIGQGLLGFGATVARFVIYIGTKFNEYKEKLKEFGDWLGGKIIEGLESIFKTISTTISTFVTNVGKAITDQAVILYNQGIAFGQLIIEGIVEAFKTMLGTITTFFSDTIKAAIDAARKIWGAKTPNLNDLTKDDDDPEPDAFVEQLIGNPEQINTSAKKAASNALISFSDAIKKISTSVNGNINFSPTIRPVVDLSDVVASGDQIDRLFGNSQRLNVSGTGLRLLSMASGYQNGRYEQPDTKAVTTPTTNVSLTQNNYSPVALSPLEIYRQTRNQLAMMKGLVGN